MPFFIKEGDITEADTECIVISADVSVNFQIEYKKSV